MEKYHLPTLGFSRSFLMFLREMKPVGDAGDHVWTLKAYAQQSGGLHSKWFPNEGHVGTRLVGSWWHSLGESLEQIAGDGL